MCAMQMRAQGHTETISNMGCIAVEQIASQMSQINDIKLSVNMPEFRARIMALKKQYGVEVNDAFKRFFLKPLVQDIVKTTPPKSRKQGVDAVFRDVGKVFQGIGSQASLSTLQYMARSDSWPANYPVINPFDKARVRSIHQARRDKRGRVRARGTFNFDGMEFDRKTFVLKDKIEAYKKQTAKAVGTLKAGWKASVNFVGAKIPYWVTKTQRSSGSVVGSLDGNGNGKITFTNGTPWANNNRMQSIISFALAKRSRDKYMLLRMGKWAKRESEKK